MAFILQLLIITVAVTDTTAMPWRTQRNQEAEEQTKIYTEGDKIELECKADGTTSVPVFHWLHDGVHFQQGPLDRLSENIISPHRSSSHAGDMVKTRSNLIIAHAKVKDSGKYTCVGDSRTKRVHISYTVVVLPATKPSAAEIAENSLRIYQWSDFLQQTEGTTLYALCRATEGLTKPSPTIRWTYAGRAIEDNIAEGIRVHSNGDLEISHVTMDYTHTDDLVCTATSDDGTRVVSKTVDWLYTMELVDNDPTSSGEGH